MKRNFLAAMMAALLISAGTSNATEDSTRLLRFPAINGNQVVFSYAGDLYTVDANGGTARRLTTDAGYEIFPKFSPDGKTIAFTGQYDGNSEVYLMPAEGGEPTRISWTPTLGRDDVSDRMGPNNIVMAWKGNDGVVFRSRGLEFNDWKGRLLIAPTDGGMTEQLPFSRGAWCSYSPDQSKIAYNPGFREFRTWKRYRGGQADDIWIYDFASKGNINITDNPAQDIFPMWYGDRIYFVSDRDEIKRFNLYYYDLKTTETKKITDFTEYDIKYPSLGDKAIVFENGGYIYKVALDKPELAAERINIKVAEDFSARRPRIEKVNNYITDMDLSPDGKRAVMIARGDLFTLPAKDGDVRNFTQTSGVHERNAVWSPNGKSIAYISDATGNDELWIIPSDGKGEAKQITTAGGPYKYAPIWSPDSKKLLWSDRSQHLYFVEVETGKVTEVAYSSKWEIRDYSWAPDSEWIAWTHPEKEGMDRIHVYSLQNGKDSPVTDNWYSSRNPAFSTDGKYLFFVSDRSFSPVSGETEYNYSYFDMSRVYVATLQADTENPFKPLSDEAAIESESEKKENKEESKDKAQESVKVKIDVEGILDRTLVLPAPAAGYYGRLTGGDNKVFYLKHGSKDKETTLFVYNLKDRKETDLGRVDSYQISANAKKMLVKVAGNYGIIDIPAGKIEIKDKLNLAGMEMLLDRPSEWEQIFGECWRQMRDFLFDPGMHGVDWKLMRERYAQLLPYINARQDLTYVIGEMISELNIGHAYVSGGDYKRPVRVQVGLLGADIRKDAESGCFVVDKIYRGCNWDRALRSPLTEIGVNIKEGDYILAINGKCAKEIKNIYAALDNTVGKQVSLMVNSKPEPEGAHTAIVLPIADEQPLRYYNWVETCIERVNKATDGKVGYIHLPDMGVPGMNEFVKHFYPQLDKKALIIDVRGNGGGNISPQVMERLSRVPDMVSIIRNTDPRWEPTECMQVGPKVCLLDQYSASDGDIFPYRFRQRKMGPLIGHRSWGGVVGIRGSLPLNDGGSLNKPEFSRYDLDGTSWIMEGYGVDPDIEINNDPVREYQGFDDQLAKGIEEALRLLKTQERNIPERPKYPVK